MFSIWNMGKLLKTNMSEDALFIFFKKIHVRMLQITTPISKEQVSPLFHTQTCHNYQVQQCQSLLFLMCDDEAIISYKIKHSDL